MRFVRLLCERGAFWEAAPPYEVALPKSLPLVPKGAHEGRAQCAKQAEVSPMKQGVPQASLRASEAAKRLEPRGHGAKRSPQGRNTAQALAQGGAKVWDDHAELRNSAKTSGRVILAHKPKVCQRSVASSKFLSLPLSCFPCHTRTHVPGAAMAFSPAPRTAIIRRVSACGTANCGSRKNATMCAMK